MFTVHCRRSASFSFLQINELAYYFPNWLLAQLTLQETSNPGMNTVEIILPRSLVQAYMLFLHCLLMCFVWYLGHINNENRTTEKTEKWSVYYKWKQCCILQFAYGAFSFIVQFFIDRCSPIYSTMLTPLCAQRVNVK